MVQRFDGAPTSVSVYRDFAEILWYPDYVNLRRFCRDFMVPRLCQFTEILWCPDLVNLQRFYGPDYVNLQTFYGARLCQFTDILWSP